MLPNIAVVDINLPGMNGQQVTHQVVQDKLDTVEDRTQAVVYALKRGWVKLFDQASQSQE